MTPGPYIQPPLDEMRLRRQWEAIAKRLRAPGRAWSPRWAGAAGLSALALGLAAWFAWRAPAGEPSALSGDRALHTSSEATSVQLEDGSRVEVAPRTTLRLKQNTPRSIQLEVRKGKARFDVVPDRKRRFSVLSGEVVVRVVGTRFEVERRTSGGERVVAVSVEHGLVEVERADKPGLLRRVAAGESWSARWPAPAAAEHEAEPEAPAGLEPQRAIEEPETVPQDEPALRPRRPEPAEPSPEQGASALFQQANLARRSGDLALAAERYARLLEQFEGDQRAGLAAFELGRIRMDSLGDPAGAIEALSRALRLAPGAGFHEDALARLIAAYETLGRMERCREARERYLSRYPRGVHANALRTRCEPQ